MSSKNLKALVQLLVEAEIIKVGGKKFALNDRQVDGLVDYLETATREGADELGVYEEKVADAGDPDTIYKYLVQALEEEAPGKVAQFKQLVDGDWSALARKDGGILDALKILAMQEATEESPGDGLEKLINAMFSQSGVGPGELTTPAFLDPLFDVYEPGRANTMGRGEVLLAFSYADAGGDPGGEYDVTLEGTPYHVKDLRGNAEGKSDKDVPLGKNAAWDKSLFPFNVLKEGGANVGELSLQGMEKAWPTMQKFYEDPEKAASVGFTGDAANPQQVAEHFQASMDKVLRESDAFKGTGGNAGGVIFAAGRKMYLVPPEDLHFSRTSQSAIRVAPGDSVPFGTSTENLMPYRAAMAQVKKEAIANILDDTSEMTLEDIVASRNYWEDATEKTINAVLKRLRELDPEPKQPQGFKWPNKSANKLPKLTSIQKYLDALPPTQELQAAHHKPSGNLFVESCIRKCIIKNAYRKEEKILREHANQIVRAQNKAKPAVKRLIFEAFSAQEKDVVNQLAGKVVDQKWKKELEDKVEALLDKQAKNFFNNDHFYKAVADVWKQLMRVYAQDQYQYARRYTRYDVPLAKYRP